MRPRVSVGPRPRAPVAGKRRPRPSHSAALAQRSVLARIYGKAPKPSSRVIVVVLILWLLWLMLGRTSPTGADVDEGANVYLAVIESRDSSPDVGIDYVTCFLQQGEGELWYASLLFKVTAKAKAKAEVATGSLVFSVPPTAEIVPRVPRSGGDRVLAATARSIATTAGGRAPRVVRTSGQNLLFFDYGLAPGDGYFDSVTVLLGRAPRGKAAGERLLRVEVSGVGGYRWSRAKDDPLPDHEDEAVEDRLKPLRTPEEATLTVKTIPGQRLSSILPATSSRQSSAREVEWTGRAALDGEVKYLTIEDPHVRREADRLLQMYIVLCGFALGYLISPRARPIRNHLSRKPWETGGARAWALQQSVRRTSGPETTRGPR